MKKMNADRGQEGTRTRRALRGSDQDTTKSEANALEVATEAEVQVLDPDAKNIPECVAELDLGDQKAVAAEIERCQAVIERSVADAAQSSMTAVEFAIKAGGLLTHAKEQWGQHGAWTLWLEANTNLSPRMAHVAVPIAPLLAGVPWP